MAQRICAKSVGREQELKKIAEFLEVDEPKGLSFLGLPQIGRSRLLCEIERRRDEYGANVCVVRIECERRTEVIRWSDLLEMIAQRVCTRFEKAVSQLKSEYEKAVWIASPRAEAAVEADNQSSSKQDARGVQTNASTDPQGKTNPASVKDALATSKTWRGFFEDLETAAPKLRVVFLLDDFDQCKPHERPQSESQAEWVTGWHFTRFVAYPNVGLITTSTYPIRQVEYFFTNFTEQWLSPFAKEEMDALVQANVLRSSPRLEKVVWRWAGGFPGLACKLLERHHSASPKLARSEIVTWLHNDVAPWFGEVWDLLHPFEQQLRADLASKWQFLAQWRFLARKRRLRVCYEREKDVAELLEEKGLISLDGEWAQLVFEALRNCD
jgi:hypothetical protein